MNKKAFIATVLATLLIISATGTLPTELPKANPANMAKLFDAASIDVQSPKNMNYGVGTISLDFTVETNNEYQPLTYYSLNGTELVEVKTTLVSSYFKTSWYWDGVNHTYHIERYIAEGHAVLSDLAQGTYSLTIQRHSGNLLEDITNKTVMFRVDQTAPSQKPPPIPKVTDVIALRNFGGFYGAVYDSGTDEVYIANVDFDLVSVISARNRTEVAEIPVGNQPLGITYDSGKGEIFVANYASNSVSVISDSNRTVVASISVGNRPTGLAYDSGTGEVFVVNRDDNTVSVISDSTNNVVATIPVGETPYGIAYSPTGKLYVTNHGDNTVSVISDSTNTVVATVQVGVNPYHAVYNSGKGEVFVTNNNSSSVSVISDSTSTVVANITVGNMPMGLTYDSRRGLVYVGNYGDNSVTVISDETNTVIATILSQQQPFALTYDSTHGQVFVAHMESWSVSVITDASETSSSPSTTATASSYETPFASTSSTPAKDGGRPNFAFETVGAVMIAGVLGLLIVLVKRRGKKT
jgi:YVTN family beta-propeller protein